MSSKNESDGSQVIVAILAIILAAIFIATVMTIVVTAVEIGYLIESNCEPV